MLMAMNLCCEGGYTELYNTFLYNTRPYVACARWSASDCLGNSVGGRPLLPAPHVSDFRVVPFLPMLVRFVVVVQFGWRVDDPYLLVVEGREAMIDERRDFDELGFVLLYLDFLNCAFGGRTLS